MKKPNDLHSRIVDYVNENLDSIEKTPEMWGTHDMIEQSYLILLDMMMFVYVPDANKRFILDEWIQIISQKSFDKQNINELMKNLINFRSKIDELIVSISSSQVI